MRRKKIRKIRELIVHAVNTGGKDGVQLPYIWDFVRSRHPKLARRKFLKQFQHVIDMQWIRSSGIQSRYPLYFPNSSRA